MKRNPIKREKTRINFQVMLPDGGQEPKCKNDQVDVPGHYDEDEFSERARALIKVRYPEGQFMGMSPTFGNTYYIKGDLLQQNDQMIIAHQANCLKAMYSGIAGSIRKIYYEAVEADQNFPLSAKARFGHCSSCNTEGTNGVVKRIYNLYGQFAPGTDRRMTDYDKLRSAFEEMMEHLDDISIPDKESVGVPFKIGCGLAGGAWRVVETIIREVANKYLRDVYIYVLPEFAGEIFETNETQYKLPRS